MKPQQITAFREWSGVWVGARTRPARRGLLDGHCPTSCCPPPDAPVGLATIGFYGAILSPTDHSGLV